MKLTLLAGLAAMALPAVAQAHPHIGLSFGIRIGPAYAYCGPRYCPPPVTYYAPPPVVYAPAPAYAPPPVVYAAPPVYYDAPPVVYGPSISLGFFGGGGH